MIVKAGAILCQRQGFEVHLKPGFEEVAIAGGNQRPVKQASVLIPKTVAPFPEVGVVVGGLGVSSLCHLVSHRKEAAVELCRLSAAGGTGYHPPLDAVALRDFRCVRRSINVNPTAIPKLIPPSLMHPPRLVNLHTVHLLDQGVQVLLPALGRRGLLLGEGT